jgi:beta-lactamase regulating signal transducer with metallopeptidase domain
VETLLHAGLSNAVSATFLAVLVACLGRVLVRRPAILHCLWLLVLLKLVTPSLYEIPISWPETLTASREDEDSFGDGGAAAYLEVVGGLEPVNSSNLEVEMLDDALADNQERAVEGPIPIAIVRAGEWLSSHWMPIVSVIWLAGTLATLAISVRRIRRFQVLLREATPASDEVQYWVDRLSASLGVRRAPEAWWISGKLSPMLWALGGCPRLIIPVDLWKSLDQGQRGTLLVHELAHLRRGDHRVRIFELAVTALYWWNPVLWWARQALRDVEEQCCDAWVVWAFPKAAKSYAETLLETLDFLNRSELSEPLLASGFGRVHHLRRRLTMIMSGSTPRLVSLWGALGALSLGALLLPINPTWAQKPEENKQVKVVVVDDPNETPEKVARIESLAELRTDLKISDDAEKIVLVVDETQLGDGQKIATVNIVGDDDDASVAIKADSVDEAIKKLKLKIGELEKQKDSADGKGKVRQETLSQLIKQLEKIAQGSKAIKAGDDAVKGQKNKTEQRVVVRMLRDAANSASPEKKAEIEKARARIKELSEALARAKTDLAKLEGTSARLMMLTEPGTTLGYRLAQPNAAVDQKRAVFLRKRIEGSADSPVNAAIVKVDPKAPQQRITIGSDDGILNKQELHVFKRSEPGSEDRIQELEKKLNKLLEEVASLKKERGK